MADRQVDPKASYSRLISPPQSFQSCNETTLPQRRVCDYCSSHKVRCDRGQPCSTCLKYGIECTASRPRKCRLKRHPDSEVLDSVELLNGESADNTRSPTSSRSDLSSTITMPGKWDETSSDLEVIKIMTTRNNELQARFQSAKSQKENQSVSTTVRTQPSRYELSWEGNAAPTDQSPTSFLEVHTGPIFPAADAVPVMEAHSLLGPATIKRVLGEMVAVSLPHCQASFTEDIDTRAPQCQEPYVIQNGILPQSQSTSSTSLSTDGHLCNSPDTVHLTVITDPQHGSTIDIPPRLVLGLEPWQMDNTSNATLSMGDSHWRCGCPREDHIAFHCDQTCWLN